METYVDLEAQVLRDGQPFTRPTRWSHGLASFGDKPEPAHWKLYPGAANTESLDVVAYVQFLGWMSTTIPDMIEVEDYIPHQWALIRAQFSIDGIIWPQALPGQLWVPPSPLSPIGLERLTAYEGWTCAIHFDSLSTMDRFKGVHTLLLRAFREEKAS